MTERHEVWEDGQRRVVHDDERSLGEIVSDLSRNFTTLMRQEVALAKAELKQSASNAGKGAGMLGGAGVAAHLALMFLSLAAWWGIAIAIGSSDNPSLGWSGLIVAVVWAIIAAILAATGKSKLNEVQGVPQTTDTVSKIPQALKGNEEENR
ncbi:phage holin family protein [Aestuariimicrobium ganziense]|uniref:phage holin family protein n=1 Tax=Aestuariimicrobium ganziense TaxID=2773677 RepID=UPI001942BA53|nr:phage holin family protein [Aestuariimicrobium ganziense]